MSLGLVAYFSKAKPWAHRVRQTGARAQKTLILVLRYTLPPDMDLANTQEDGLIGLSSDKAIMEI
jgi:hypothetical protein